MHAGGSFLRSAFYGGRIAGGLTIGAATKIIHGISHSRGNINHSKNGERTDSERFSESDSSGNSGGE
jgi:hypothetical protein